MEYLGATQGRSREDVNLIRELGRQLEALRFYDQYDCDPDWRLSEDRRHTESFSSGSKT
jgi:hypothetical protein